MTRVMAVPQSALRLTWDHLRWAGARGDECFVLWAGADKPWGQLITKVIRPEQQALRTARGEVGVYVPGDALFAITRSLYETGDVLLAQVHAHPGRAYHSETDNRYPIVTHHGALSVVVPDFARGSPDLRSCACYQLGPAGWTLLTPNALKALVQVVP